MLDTRILQFSCGLANYKATKPIFDAVDPNTHQVLAIQEQAFNRVTGSLTVHGVTAWQVTTTQHLKFVSWSARRFLLTPGPFSHMVNTLHHYICN